MKKRKLKQWVAQGSNAVDVQPVGRGGILAGPRQFKKRNIPVTESPDVDDPVEEFSDDEKPQFKRRKLRLSKLPVAPPAVDPYDFLVRADSLFDVTAGPPRFTRQQLLDEVELNGYVEVTYSDPLRDKRYLKGFPTLRLRKSELLAEGDPGKFHEIGLELTTGPETLQPCTLGFLDGDAVGNSRWRQTVQPQYVAQEVRPAASWLREGVTLDHTSLFNQGFANLWFMNNANKLLDPVSGRRYSHKDNNVKVCSEGFRSLGEGDSTKSGRIRVSVQKAVKPFTPLMRSFGGSYENVLGRLVLDNGVPVDHQVPIAAAAEAETPAADLPTSPALSLSVSTDSTVAQSFATEDDDANPEYDGSERSFGSSVGCQSPMRAVSPARSEVPSTGASSHTVIDLVKSPPDAEFESSPSSLVQLPLVVADFEQSSPRAGVIARLPYPPLRPGVLPRPRPPPEINQSVVLLQDLEVLRDANSVQLPMSPPPSPPEEYFPSPEYEPEPSPATFEREIAEYNMEMENEERWSHVARYELDYGHDSHGHADDSDESY